MFYDLIEFDKNNFKSTIFVTYSSKMQEMLSKNDCFFIVTLGGEYKLTTLTGIIHYNFGANQGAWYFCLEDSSITGGKICPLTYIF